MLKSEKRKAWAARIADYQQSKLTIREWCAKHGVTERQLWYWRRRLQAKPGVSTSSSPGGGPAQEMESVVWTPVQIASESACEGGGIAIHVGCARIEIRAGFDHALLSEVVCVLASSPGSSSGSGPC
jgi:transposase-like protein